MLFSVFDLETTGLSPARGDRIVEIGIVLLDQSGKVIQEFESLVNPHRDVGPTFIHGITASMVHDAPAFSELEQQVLTLLSGTVLVGHNIAFDLRFLKSELPALWAQGDQELPSVCTLRLCRNHLSGLPNNKLESLCAYYGIDNELSHSALSDARATARAFTLLSREFDLYDSYPAPSVCRRPELTQQINCRGYSRNDHASEPDTVGSSFTFFSPALSKSEDTKTEGICIEYSRQLAASLLDRHLNEQKLDDLGDLIKTHRLNGQQVLAHHQIYLKSLEARYRKSGRVSSLQQEDLSRVRRLLCIEEETITDSRPLQETALPSLDGATICFTGSLDILYEGQRMTRTRAQELAVRYGMFTRAYVSSRTDYLIASDALSCSTKAKRARALGVPIIDARFFFSLLGV